MERSATCRLPLFSVVIFAPEHGIDPRLQTRLFRKLWELEGVVGNRFFE
jgi:hypothetical protein